MNQLPQNNTGDLTETRVKKKLESLGLIVRKPVPDNGIDFEVFDPLYPNICAKIQVKGRNPKKITTYRWFQLRIPKAYLEHSRLAEIPAEETWKEKVRKVDFFILDAVVPNEMWVLTQEQTFQLIALNEDHFNTRPDNIFRYEYPLKGKQKEMNLEAPVTGIPIIMRFESCKNNFVPLIDFLTTRHSGEASGSFHQSSD